jgi:alpha-1,6-mannosyltransferase
MANAHRKFVSSWLLLLLFALILSGGIIYITYFVQRDETGRLLIVYSLLFITYIAIILLAKSDKEIYILLGVSLFVRFVLLPALPPLSDDFYRFLWDGMLINQGRHPFAQVPTTLVAQGHLEQFPPIAPMLYQQMNSPDYFTIYPPVCQALFAAASFLFPNSLAGGIIMIRLPMLVAEAISIFFIFKLLRIYKLPSKYILLYALNPLVILELSGNLHFEVLMICFLLVSVYFFQQNRLMLSAIFFGLAICTKLVPLIFLPLFIRRLGIRKAIYYFGMVGISCLLLFLPLLNAELVKGLQSSIGLYFQKFEFNASIYYIVREIGYVVKGFNIIEQAGRWLAICAFVCIILFSIFERCKRLPEAFLWILMLYYPFATIVHPWYITPLVAFSIFSKFRFAIVWSLLAFFTYAGYSPTGYYENLIVVFFEYSITLVVLAYEVWLYADLNSLKGVFKKSGLGSISYI